VLAVKVKNLVSDPEWQRVRQSLVGNWNLKPEECCSQLIKFLGPVENTPEEKLRIVMNYLTGTGFRTGKIKHACVSNLRGQISAELKKRKFQKV
jgi:hypothetical protein